MQVWILLVLAFARAQHAVFLPNLTSLEFERGFYTHAGRIESKPQLVCVGELVCGTKKEPTKVNCNNTSLNDLENDPVWICTSSPPVEFGHIEVACEGYDHFHDINILVGSCQLRYAILKGPYIVYTWEMFLMDISVFLAECALIVFVLFMSFVWDVICGCNLNFFSFVVLYSILYWFGAYD